MKSILTIILITLIALISCAPQGTGTLERVSLFIQDINDSMPLGQHFHSASKMYDRVHDYDQLLNTLFLPTLASPELLQIVNHYKIDTQTVYAEMDDGTTPYFMTFELEYELYSPFHDDYRITRIIRDDGGVLVEVYN